MKLGHTLLGAAILLILTACGPSIEDVQVMVNEAVKDESGKLMQAIVEEAKKNPGPAGERGERGAAGPDVSEERLAIAVQAAIENVELPEGPRGIPGPKGDAGERGPEIGDERLMAAVESALAQAVAALELPAGPQGPAGPKGDAGERGAPAEIPPELLDNRYEMMQMATAENCCGSEFADSSGIARVTLFAGDDSDIEGVEFRDTEGGFKGGVWTVGSALFLVAPDGTIVYVYAGDIKVDDENYFDD